MVRKAETKPPYPRFLAAGCSALLVEFGDCVSMDLNRQTIQLLNAIQGSDTPGILALVPSYRSLLIDYDIRKISGKALTEKIKCLIGQVETRKCSRATWSIPSCYDETLGLDIAEIAKKLDATTDDVAGLHQAQAYDIYMIGFLPGFPYAGDLPQQLQFPRKTTPRLKIPAGSVAIATNQTAIYPIESPGGWHILGRTPIKLFNPQDDPPVPFAPGDRLHFESVSLTEYRKIEKAVSKGEFILQVAS